jgi:uncharacterized protein (DUF302 family)
MKKLNLILVGLLLSVFVSNAQVGTEPKMGDNYFFSKTVEGTVESVTDRLKEALKSEGFSVVTEIDMDKTLKEKIDVDYKPYRILGVCNATYAYQTLQIEENIGVFLPCKMVIKQVDEKAVEVVSVNPTVLMQAMGNIDLSRVADQVTEKLQKVVEKL